MGSGIPAIRAPAGVLVACFICSAALEAQVPQRRLPRPVRPPARFLAAAATDVARGRIVLFGGISDSGTFFNDTWEWTGTAWLSRRNVHAPDPRSYAAAAFDATRRQTVLFSGSTFMDAYRDTWLWNGNRWWRPDSGLGPPARSNPAMANDTARHRLVMFGGGGGYGDTWEWDGAGWIEIVPAGPSPPAREGHALVYDLARGRTILFGGQSADGRPLNDMWEWDGVRWTQLTPSVKPPARSAHAMAQDASRLRVLLFGGYAGQVRLGDTWEWDGVTWVERQVKVAPAPREGALLAYDPVGKRLVLFGGVDTVGALNDTWAWDGRRWSLLVPPTPRDTVGLQAAWTLFWARREVAVLNGRQKWHFATQGRYARSLAEVDLDTVPYANIYLTMVTDSGWAGYVERGSVRCGVFFGNVKPPFVEATLPGQLACTRTAGPALTPRAAADSARRLLGRALAILRGPRDDRPRARDLLTRAVALFRAGGMPAEAGALIELSTLDEEEGHRDSALQELRLAVKLQRHWGRPDEQTLVQLGALYRRAGQPDSALAYLRAALERADGRLTSTVLTSIGDTHLDAGRMDSASASFEGAHVAALRVRDPSLQKQALLGKARLADALGRLDEAARYRAQAANIPP